MEPIRLSASDKIVSDTHFGHSNIIRYCRRPYRDAQEMDEDLVRRWNAKVDPDDTVYHLGDVLFSASSPVFKRVGGEDKGPRRVLERLNGKIVLIQGNHDRRSHNDLYHEAHKSLSVQVGPHLCLFHHYPLGVSDPFEKRKHDPSLLEEAERHDFVVCGHVHEKWWVNGRNLNVGIDVRDDLAPMTAAELIADLGQLASLSGKSMLSKRTDQTARARCLLGILEHASKAAGHPALEELSGLYGAAHLLAERAAAGCGIAEEALKAMGPAGAAASRRLAKEKELKDQGLSNREIRRRLGDDPGTEKR